MSAFIRGFKVVVIAGTTFVAITAFIVAYALLTRWALFIFDLVLK